MAKNALCSQQCELYHWVDLLDRFDGILCDAGQTVENMSWLLVCDRPDNGQLKALLLAVLNFTALLIEYSFSRHLYSSIEVRLPLQRSSSTPEFSPPGIRRSSLTSVCQHLLSFQHLTTLLASCDMQVVLSVLNLLYVFSKRSNYITRLGSDKRTPLLARLQHLAEVWKWIFHLQARLLPALKWQVALLLFLLSSVELGREREWLWPRWVLQGSAHDGNSLYWISYCSLWMCTFSSYNMYFF